MSADHDTPDGTRRCSECDGWGYVRAGHGNYLSPDDTKTCPTCLGEGLEYIDEPSGGDK